MSRLSRPFRTTLKIVIVLTVAHTWLAPGGRCQEVLPRPTLTQDLPSPAERLPANTATRPERFNFVGTASCSATSCHGRPGSSATIGSEYSVWSESDPHARAYSTLYSDRSKSIAKRLGYANAHESKQCLACHTSYVAETQLTANHRYTIHDGVGCESCHGPAEKWLEPHKRVEWKYDQFWSEKDKADVGFNDTSNLLTRAKTCAKCHVGSSGRDVNHDLIAAGHPRLYFELSAYHANLPRHWNRERDKQENTAALEARLWAIGQVVSAEAAIDLLEQRARLSDGSLNRPQDRHRSLAPWPEFAEHNCFACHHDLGGQRGLAIRRNSPPGILPWSQWHFATLEAATTHQDSLGSEDYRKDISALADGFGDLTQVMSRSFPDRQAVRVMAGELRKKLGSISATLSRRQFSELDLHEYFQFVSDPEFQPEQTNWDNLSQRYLAMVALRQGIIESRQAAGISKPKWSQSVGSELEKIRATLLFPRDDATQYASPKNLEFRLKDIEKSFSAIHQLLEDR